VVAACSNAVAGVLLDRGREGVQKLLPGLEKMSDVSSSAPPALEKCHPKQFSSYLYWVVLEALK
jgi:hypothetical protein